MGQRPGSILVTVKDPCYPGAVGDPRSGRDAARASATSDVDCNGATTEVLKSITSVLVPLSVFMLPNSEKLVPAIDAVVDRNFDIVTKFVEWQYEFGITALNLLGSFASN
jgi:hypothetical protein